MSAAVSGLFEMIVHYLLALMEVFAVDVCLALACWGWGDAMVRALGIVRSYHSTTMWIGWAIMLLLFQVLHLGVALTGYVVMPVFVAGVLLTLFRLIPGWRDRCGRCDRLRHGWVNGRSVLLTIAALVIIGWVASRSMLTPERYDSGLYHLTSIRWINSYPIVPGLGNLHMRLAFNQSFFTYAAALNFAPWFNHGRAIANTFLFLLTVGTCVEWLRPVFHRPRLLTESHPFKYAPALWTLPLLAYIGLRTDDFASPSPDLAAIFLQLVLFIATCRYLLALNDDDRDDIDGWFALVMILGATAVTVKLSNLAFGGVLMTGVVLTRLRPGYRIRSKRLLLDTGICVVAILGVWMVRSIVLSGTPLFPSTMGRLAVDWAVPAKDMTTVADAIRSWARRPYVPADQVLHSWGWLGPWADDMRKKTVDVAYPLVLAVVFLILSAIIYRGRRRTVRGQLWQWSLLLPIVLGLVYWFVMAPDPRLAHALFWCLSIAAAMVLLCHVRPMMSAQKFFTLLWIVFFVTNLMLIAKTVGKLHRLGDISLIGWHPVPKVALIDRQTDSGLVVHVPAAGDQCWDAPLPCTPELDPALRLRVPGDMAGGFTVAPPSDSPAKH